MNPPAEHCDVEIRIPNDLRALGAARGALEHTARHLGLPQDEGEQLADSLDHILRSGLAAMAPDEDLLVRIQEHPGHISIEIVRPGGSGAEWAALRNLPGIDQIEEETSAAGTRLKLHKRVPGPGHSPQSAD
jgi:hypothetical protein